MSTVLGKITTLLNRHQQCSISLTERVLGKGFDTNNKVAIYGAGIIGAELSQSLANENVNIDFFLDSDPSKAGKSIAGVPIRHIEACHDLSGYHIIIAVASKHKAEEIATALTAKGFNQANTLLPLHHAADLAAYIAEPAYMTRNWLVQFSRNELMEKLHADQAEIEAVHAQLGDEKSREILATKLACLIDPKNLDLLGFFIRNYSEPFAKWGEFSRPHFFPESACYFDNDLFRIEEGATLIDIGAYDGCSTAAFIEMAQKNGVSNCRSLAFEPDPDNFAALASRFAGTPNVQCLNYAVHAEKAALKFVSSANCSLKSSSYLSPNGNITVEAMPLDAFDLDHVSIIKADPPGLDIAINALQGAQKTIAKHKPILIFPGYHDFDAIYKMPSAIHRLFPGQYRLYLRHLSWSIGETDVFALPQ